jgi:hypothetical protein
MYIVHEHLWSTPRCDQDKVQKLAEKMSGTGAFKVEDSPGLDIVEQSF